MVKKLIQQIIIPLFVTALVVLLLLIEDSLKRYNYWVAFEIFLIFILPMLPIVYGYLTRDKVGAILMGVLAFAGFFGLMLFEELLSPNISTSWLNKAIPFYFILITIAGFEGYFASQRKILTACSLCILWILIFLLFGIH
nr:hypothetical membrane protein [uncultured archaeon]